MLHPCLSPLRSCWKEGRAGLWGAAHSHLHIVTLTGLAPQVVYLLHKAAPSASPSARLLWFLGVPGQLQPQRWSPLTPTAHSARQLMPGWVHGQAALHSPSSRSQAVLGPPQVLAFKPSSHVCPYFLSPTLGPGSGFSGERMCSIKAPAGP